MDQKSIHLFLQILNVIMHKRKILKLLKIPKKQK